MWQNSDRCVRGWISTQQILVRSEKTSTGRQQLVGVRCLPELMSLCRGPRNQRCRAREQRNFPPNLRAQRPAVESLLSAPAEHRLARHETDSEWSRYLLEAVFLVLQPGSPVAMTQRREAKAKCLEGLE